MATKLFLTNIDLNGNELQNTLIHKLGTEPSGLGTGHIFYDTSVNRAKLLISTGPDTWQTLGQVNSIAASGNYITIGGTATAPTVAVANTSATGGSDKIIITDGSGNTDLGAGTISSSAVPTTGNHLTNKTYVDSLVTGLSWKDSVRTATSAPGTLATDFENGDLVGGVTVATNDRILIKDQGTASENGIYIVQASGAPVRASDMDTWAEVPSAAVFVEEGTNADSGWVCTSNAGGTLNTTAITFVQFNGSTAYTGGDGITITGNTIDIDLVNTNSGLKFTSTELELDLAANGGLTKTGGLQLATSVAGNGLTLTTGVLDVATGNGIQISSDAVAVRLNSNAGLVANTGTGTNELKINLATSSALALTTNELAVVVDGTTIEINGSNQLAIKAPYGVRKFTVTASAGNTTNFASNGAHVFTITHNFNTADVIVQVRNSTDEVVGVNIDTTGPNSVTASYNAAANTTLYAVVIG